MTLFTSQWTVTALYTVVPLISAAWECLIPQCGLFVSPSLLGKVTNKLVALMAQVLTLGHTLRAPGTLHTYNGHCKALTKFCSTHGLKALPPTDLTTSLYLMDLHNRETPWQTFTSACSAISFAHEIAYAPSPIQGKWTSRVKEMQDCTPLTWYEPRTHYL